MTKQTKKTKTASTKRRPIQNRSTYQKLVESDSQYLLKLVVVILIATFWLKFSAPVVWLGYMFTAVPVGLFLGLILIHTFEHEQIDRKIWYVVLIIVAIIGNFAPVGIVI